MSIEIRGSTTARLAPVDAQPLVVPAPARARGPYERVVKPVVDRLGAALLLLLASPVLAVVAITVWLALGNPVLLRQERIGLDGRAFRMLKFRTMHPDRRRRRDDYDGADRRRTHKSPHDPRLTPVGRFLRRWSLDELPQLWNVLRGDMSLVGPRPELAAIVARYEAWQHGRHAVKPGLTGLWQVTERDGAGEMHRHTSTDLRYIEQLSLATDLKILLLTLPAALGLRRGF